MIPEDYWEACEVDGKIYAVPTYKDSSMSEYLIWDKELAESTGYTIPDAIEMSDLGSITDTLLAMKEKTGEASFPMNASGATWATFEYDNMGAGLLPLGVRYDDETATVVSVLEQEDVQATLDIFREWYNDGIINSDAATKPESNSYNACSVGQGWPSAAITTWGPNMGVEAATTKLGATIISNDTVRGSLNCISANCAYPEKALQLLELVNTDSYVRDLLYYGVEGDNWDYTDDTKEWVHKNNANWLMAGYTQGSFFTVTPTDDFDFNQFDEVKELNENAEPSVLLGFTLDITNFKDELSNCVSIFERYRGELLSGTHPTEEVVPQIMEELRAAGFDDIVAQCQEQVDAFMATK
jgi:putative aldouronate transport system substrate-binding protein